MLQLQNNGALEKKIKKVLILKTIYYDLALAKLKVQYWNEVEIAMLMKLVPLFLFRNYSLVWRVRSNDVMKYRRLGFLISILFHKDK